MRDFVSPGAAASEALDQAVRQREMERRQAMLDAITQRSDQRDHDLQRNELALRRDQETRVSTAQRQQQEALEQEREFRRAQVISENALPDDPVDGPTAELLKRQGFGGQVRPGSTPAAVPGVMAEGGTAEPSYQLRGGSRYVSQRATEDARRQQADDANQTRRDIAETNAAQRAEAAAARLEQARTSADVGRARLELQQALADLRIDETRKARRDQESAVAVGRSEVRELAQSLIDDPALDGISGPIEGRRDTFYRSGNVDALKRLQQLVNKLSLEGRGKLKGQGAVSDFEGRMLAAAMSSIDRAAGPDTVRKHLRDVVKAFEGDRPFEQESRSTGPAIGTRRTINGQAAEWDGRGWLPVGR